MSSLAGSIPEILNGPQSPEAKNPIFYMGMIQFLVPVGGITSHVILEARPDPRIDEALLTPNLANGTVEMRLKLVRQRADKSWQGQAAIHIRPAKLLGPTATAAASVDFAAEATQSETASAIVALPNLHPWSPEDPFLYLVEITVSDGKQTVDRQTIRSGFRELKATPEGHFLLNGKPCSLRGVGYDSLEPITGVPVPDKKVYVEGLRLLKKYGFNFVRFLAHTPCNEFFEAADEEGVLLQTEGEWFLGEVPCRKRPGNCCTPGPEDDPRVRPSSVVVCLQLFQRGSGGKRSRQAAIRSRGPRSLSEDEIPPRFFLASDGGDDLLRSKRQLRAGQWNHVGLTWDGKRVRLFVNGHPDAEVGAAFSFQPRESRHRTPRATGDPFGGRLPVSNWMSTTTTSGRASSRSFTAWSVSAAWPQTSKSGWEAMRTASPSRTAGWSSTIKTLVAISVVSDYFSIYSFSGHRHTTRVPPFGPGPISSSPPINPAR